MVGVKGAYYNEFDPNAAAWLRELIKRGLIAPGENAIVPQIAAEWVKAVMGC